MSTYLPVFKLQEYADYTVCASSDTIPQEKGAWILCMITIGASRGGLLYQWETWSPLPTWAQSPFSSVSKYSRLSHNLYLS